MDEKNNVKIGVSQLKKGMIVPSYREMCNLLGEKVGSGNQKRSQLKEWKRYFQFTRKGNSFIITKIYKEPLPSNDGRHGRTGIYTKYIEFLLMEYLANSPDEVVYISKMDLFKLLGLVPPKYSKLKSSINAQERLLALEGKSLNNCSPAEKHDRECFVYERIKRQFIYSLINTEYSEYIDTFKQMSPLEIKDFYQRVYSKVGSIVRDALKSMSNRKLIDYYKVYKIIYRTSAGYETVIADDRQREDILRIERKVLLLMGYDGFTDVIFAGKSGEYYKRVNELVQEELGCAGVYSCYKIIHLKDMISQAIPAKAEEIRNLTTGDKILGLNNEVIEYLNRQAKELYIEQQQKNELDKENVWGINPMSFEYFKFKYEGDYVLIQEALAEYIFRLSEKESETLARGIRRGNKHRFLQNDDNNEVDALKFNNRKDK